MLSSVYKDLQFLAQGLFVVECSNSSHIQTNTCK